MTEPERLADTNEFLAFQERVALRLADPEFQAKEQERREREDRERAEAEVQAEHYAAEQLRARIGAVVPRRFLDAQMSVPEVIAWTRGFIEGRDGSLLLTGRQGTGKSHNAYAAVRTLMQADPHGSIIGGSTPRLLNRLRPEGDMHLDMLIDAGLVLLDDFGVEKSSEWVEQQLYIVIEERYAAMRPLLITTNVTPAKFSAEFGSRIASRLSQMCEVVTLTGPDRRMA